MNVFLLVINFAGGVGNVLKNSASLHAKLLFR